LFFRTPSKVVAERVLPTDIPSKGSSINGSG
jgi:hypothetical protein